METIQELREALDRAYERMAAANAVLQALSNNATPGQVDQAKREWDTAEAEHRAAELKLGRAEARGNLRVRPDDDKGGARVRGESLTYERGNGQSYFLDLARAERGHGEARQRLERHGSEMEVELRDRAQRRQRGFDEGYEELLQDLPPHLRAQVREQIQPIERRDLTRTDGQGGHFVPPIWLMDEYAEAARAGRPFVDACRVIPLPGGTDSINIPLILTGTATGVQTADNAAVTETDLTDAVVTSPVRTIAGQQDLPLQLLEQSPAMFDEVVFADLIADYNFRLEDQCLNGTGAAGQIKGIRNVSGIGTTTYTDASPTVPELYPKIAGALSTARTARKRPITHGWWAPRRYYWAASALDAQLRPIVIPQIQGPNNALGVRLEERGGGSGEDPALFMLAPLRVSDAIPTNVGGGTNEDLVLLTRQIDHIVFEGELRARALMEVLSGTLQVRLQIYNYVAASFERFPSATNIVTGTGLVAPIF